MITLGCTRTKSNEGKKMTNKQFLIGEIKKLLQRDDLADAQRVRLLSLLARHVPAPRRR